jgi:hypothetical protein
LVVEHDCGGERGEAGEEAYAEVSECASAVALEREDVFAGPEDRFDPLADRREVRVIALVLVAAGLRGDQRCRSQCRGGRRRPLCDRGCVAFLVLASWSDDRRVERR